MLPQVQERHEEVDIGVQQAVPLRTASVSTPAPRVLTDAQSTRSAVLVQERCDATRLIHRAGRGCYAQAGRQLACGAHPWAVFSPSIVE